MRARKSLEEGRSGSDGTSAASCSLSLLRFVREDQLQRGRFTEGNFSLLSPLKHLDKALPSPPPRSGYSTLLFGVAAVVG